MNSDASAAANSADESQTYANIAQSLTEYKGAWDDVTSYIVGDSVSFSGAVWIADQNNTNQEPSNSSSYWTNIKPNQAMAVGNINSPLLDLPLKNSRS